MGGSVFAPRRDVLLYRLFRFRSVRVFQNNTMHSLHKKTLSLGGVVPALKITLVDSSTLDGGASVLVSASAPPSTVAAASLRAGNFFFNSWFRAWQAELVTSPWQSREPFHHGPGIRTENVQETKVHGQLILRLQITITSGLKSRLEVGKQAVTCRSHARIHATWAFRYRCCILPAAVLMIPSSVGSKRGPHFFWAKFGFVHEHFLEPYVDPDGSIVLPFGGSQHNIQWFGR